DTFRNRIQLRSFLPEDVPDVGAHRRGSSDVEVREDDDRNVVVDVALEMRFESRTASVHVYRTVSIPGVMEPEVAYGPVREVEAIRLLDRLRRQKATVLQRFVELQEIPGAAVERSV